MCGRDGPVVDGQITPVQVFRAVAVSYAASTTKSEANVEAPHRSGLNSTMHSFFERYAGTTRLSTQGCMRGRFNPKGALYIHSCPESHATWTYNNFSSTIGSLSPKAVA